LILDHSLTFAVQSDLNQWLVLSVDHLICLHIYSDGVHCDFSCGPCVLV
jgi:hypothetical protein